VPGLVTGPSELDSEEYKTDEFRMYSFKVSQLADRHDLQSVV
jgi:hypothetical protein